MKSKSKSAKKKQKKQSIMSLEAVKSCLDGGDVEIVLAECLLVRGDVLAQRLELLCRFAFPLSETRARRLLQESSDVATALVFVPRLVASAQQAFALVQTLVLDATLLPACALACSRLAVHISLQPKVFAFVSGIVASVPSDFVTSAVALLTCSFDPASVQASFKTIRRHWHAARLEVGLFEALPRLKSALVPTLLTRADVRLGFWNTMRDERLYSCVDVVLLVSISDVFPQAIECCVDLLLRASFLKQELMSALQNVPSSSFVRLLRAILKRSGPDEKRFLPWLGPVLADVYLRDAHCRPLLTAVALGGLSNFVGCEMLELVLQAKQDAPQDAKLFSPSVVDQLVGLFTSDRSVAFCCERVQRVGMMIGQLCGHSGALCRRAEACVSRLCSSVFDSWRMVGLCIAKHMLTRGFLSPLLLETVLAVNKILSPFNIHADGSGLLIQIFLLDLLALLPPDGSHVQELRDALTMDSKHGFKLHSARLNECASGVFAGEAKHGKTVDWRPVWAFRVSEILAGEDVGIFLKGQLEWAVASAQKDAKSAFISDLPLLIAHLCASLEEIQGLSESEVSKLGEHLFFFVFRGSRTNIVHRICCLQRVASGCPELRPTLAVIPSVPLKLLLSSILVCDNHNTLSDLLQYANLYLYPIVRACFGLEECDAQPGKNMYGRPPANDVLSDSTVELFTSLPYAIDWDRRTRGRLDFKALRSVFGKDDLCKAFKSCFKSHVSRVKDDAGSRLVVANCLRFLSLVLSLFVKMKDPLGKRFLIGLTGMAALDFPKWVDKNVRLCQDASFSVFWIDLMIVASKIEPAMEGALRVVQLAFQLPFCAAKKVPFPVEIPVALSAPLLLGNAQAQWSAPNDSVKPAFLLFFDISPESTNPKLSLHIYLLSCLSCFQSPESFMQLCTDTMDALDDVGSALCTVHSMTVQPLVRIQLVELIRIGMRKSLDSESFLSVLTLAERLVKFAKRTGSVHVFNSFIKLGDTLFRVLSEREIVPGEDERAEVARICVSLATALSKIARKSKKVGPKRTRHLQSIAASFKKIKQK